MGRCHLAGASLAGLVVLLAGLPAPWLAAVPHLVPMTAKSLALHPTPCFGVDDAILLGHALAPPSVAAPCANRLHVLTLLRC